MSFRSTKSLNPETDRRRREVRDREAIRDELIARFGTKAGAREELLAATTARLAISIDKYNKRLAGGDVLNAEEAALYRNSIDTLTHGLYVLGPDHIADTAAENIAATAAGFAAAIDEMSRAITPAPALGGHS